jgi:hypothetical protein
MSTNASRLVFAMGDAFPPESPVAVFIVAISMALNDLLITSLRTSVVTNPELQLALGATMAE